eukprot:PhM_4_TR14170/c1_g1_i2/m.47369
MFVKRKLDKVFHQVLSRIVHEKKQAFDHVLFSFGVWHLYTANETTDANLFTQFKDIIDNVLSYTRQNQKAQPPYTFLPIRPIHPQNRLYQKPQNCSLPTRVEAYRRLQRCVFDCAMAQHGVRRYNILNITNMARTPLARAM